MAEDLPTEFDLIVIGTGKSLILVFLRNIERKDKTNNPNTLI